jgi:hypothetical protein
MLRRALPLAAFSLAACAQILGDDFHLATGGSGSGGGGRTDCPTTTTECKDFCAAIDDNNSCVIPQFGNTRNCEAVCTLAYESDIECRTLASGTLPSNCTVAGPSGVSPLGEPTCGPTLCQQYCRLQEKICGFGNSPAPYPNQEECLEHCDDLKQGLPYDAERAPDRGATIACGLSQLVLAACDPATYCPQSRPGSAGPCGKPACLSCAEAVDKSVTDGLMSINEVCSGKDGMTYTTLVACACATDCSSPCGTSCGGDPVDPLCQDCVATNCSDQLAACGVPPP